MRKDLYENIILTGGCTMFEGIVERLEKEVKAIAPKKMEPKVIATAERKYQVWIGG